MFSLSVSVLGSRLLQKVPKHQRKAVESVAVLGSELQGQKSLTSSRGCLEHPIGDPVGKPRTRPIGCVSRPAESHNYESVTLALICAKMCEGAQNHKTRAVLLYLGGEFRVQHHCLPSIIHNP